MLISRGTSRTGCGERSQSGPRATLTLSGDSQLLVACLMWRSSRGMRIHWLSRGTWHLHNHVESPGDICHQQFAALGTCILVNIDCTGLGGPDWGGFKDYDICLRTDKHSQSIYGPSVTPLESPGRDGTHQVTQVAVGGSKAMHEFLVLHYLATDSAREWDVFLVHGYVLALDGRLPYICTTSATLPHPIDGLPSFLDCGNEVSTRQMPL